MRLTPPPWFGFLARDSAGGAMPLRRAGLGDQRRPASADFRGLRPGGAYSVRNQVWVRPMNRIEPRISSLLPPSITVSLAL